MQISELTSHLVRLPLRKPFKHASHARQDSENIFLCCRLRDGTQGWGEGVPRPYVTGETPERDLAQLAATPLADQLGADCTSWDDVIQLCANFRPAVLEEDPRGCGANALRCAVELSILDAYGRLFGEPLSHVTHQYEPAAPLRTSLDRVRYSGAIDAAGSPRKEVISALKMRVYGFAHCKVKVGTGADEVGRLTRIRCWLGRRMDIRVDANEAWSAQEAVSRLEPLVPLQISCAEQPVAHAEIAALADVRRQVPIPIMLDESLTSRIDAERAIAEQTCDLFNIRLSKCGGFLHSLELAALAHAANLGYQLGCHPGESGILSAAGRHFATSVRNIRYREGSYDHHLLSVLPTNEDMTFSYGGYARALRSPGHGVTVNQGVLQSLSARSARYPLS